MGYATICDAKIPYNHQFRVLAAPLLIQVPTNAPRKAVADGMAHVAYMGDPDGDSAIVGSEALDEQYLSLFLSLSLSSVTNASCHLCTLFFSFALGHFFKASFFFPV